MGDFRQKVGTWRPVLGSGVETYPAFGLWRWYSKSMM